MNWQEYIKPELLILIPVLILVGVGLKKSPIPDRWIPALLGGISILLTSLYVFSTTEIVNGASLAGAVFTAVTQGVLAAGGSVYAHQLVKQTKKEG